MGLILAAAGAGDAKPAAQAQNTPIHTHKRDLLLTVNHQVQTMPCHMEEALSLGRHLFFQP